SLHMPFRSLPPMPLTFASIGILARTHNAHVQQTLAPLISHLLKRGAQVLVDQALAWTTPGTTQCDKADMGLRCDLVLVVGGDGTLLDACRAVANHQTPLLGINLGRLGFLVDVSPESMCEALDNVLAGRFIQQARLRLAARIVRANGE